MDIVRLPKQFGNIVRRTRKELGWSQTALGERAGLRQETVSRIETGNPAVRLDTALAVLAALGLELQAHPRTQGARLSLEDMFP